MGLKWLQDSDLLSDPLPILPGSRHIPNAKTHGARVGTRKIATQAEAVYVDLYLMRHL